jgi:TPR repeat protein
MRRLTASICLTITLLVGNPAFSADLQKGLTAYKSGDFATALREWTPLAKQGDARSQYALGVMYDKRDLVPQDYKTAVKWYRLSAEQGNASAQGNLGGMYSFGKGVVKDYVYAHMWGNIAVSIGGKDKGKVRDLVEKKMTPAQIADAQTLARECVRKKYKGC